MNLGVTEDQLDMIRRFAGADPDADTSVLIMAYLAAASWYEQAGVPADCGVEMYDFWVCNLAAWYYDHRGDSGEIPKLYIASVHQLRPLEE